jgi:hypothetical protein
LVFLPLLPSADNQNLNRYGDVKPEIAPVTSGYRFVLTYNLINTNPWNPAKTPVEFDTKKNELENALKLWKDNYRKHNSSCPRVLVYILEYLYTRPSLSFLGLKGGDSLRGQCLVELCEKLGFEFFLAGLEREVSGDCDGEDNDEGAWEDMYWRSVRNQEPKIHSITDIKNQWLYLSHIANLQGTELLDEVPLSESHIVQKDPFPDGPNEEDFTGPTGNQGVSATHYYRRSVSPNSDQKPVEILNSWWIRLR